MAKVTVEVDEERIVERIVETIVMEGDWRDGSEDESRFIRAIKKRVEKELDARIGAALDAALQDDLRARVLPRIEQVVREGFPRFNEWGDPTGTMTWEQAVKGALDSLFKPNGSGYSRDSWAVKAAKEAFEKTAAATFKAEVETIRAKVRAYVDEQLSGAVVKALREAVGLKAGG